jgi:WD40 repeat protein
MGAVDNIYAYNLMTSLDQSDVQPERLANIALSDFLSRLVRKTVVDAAGQRTVQWLYKPELAVESPADGPAQPTTGPRFVLLIDQFEEIVTGHPERWREREGFFRQLNQALLDDLNLWIVLTLREDYVASLDPYAELTFNRLRARFYMERMGVDAALEAICRPAELAGRPFAPGVAEKVVDDLRQVRVTGLEATALGQYVEPVQLQVVCYQLWERLTRSREGLPAVSAGDAGKEVLGQAIAPIAITEEDLAAAGDVNQALERFYTETLAAVLGEPEVQDADVGERALRTWFDRELITETGIRNTIFRNETAGRTGSLPNVTVDALAGRFLLRTEPRGGGAWVELVHDRFVQPIQSANRAWFAQNQNSLTQRAAAWQEAGKLPAKLLKGERLQEAQTAMKNRPGDFSRLEQEFVAASAEVERLAVARRQRLVAAAAVALIVIFAALAAAAFLSAVRATQASEFARAEQARAEAERLRAETEEKRAVAEEERAVAEEERANAERQNALALYYLASAQSAVSSGTLPERSAILSAGAIQFARDQGSLQPATGVDQLQRTLASLGGLPLRAHQGAVNAVAFNPACQVKPSEPPAAPCTVGMASGGDDGAIRLWNIRNPFSAPVTLFGHSAPVQRLAFSPVGRWLASAGADRTARLWDLTTAPPSAQTLDVGGDFHQLGFSPSGRWLAAATHDSRVRLWDMAGASPLAAPRLLDQSYLYVIGAVFSSDERRLMTASQDGFAAGEVRLWQADDEFAQPEAIYSYGYIAGATMSPDGNWLAVSTDRLIEIRYIGADNADAVDRVQQFSDFPYIYAMGFSPDSRAFSSGGSLWQLTEAGRWQEPVRLVGQPQGGVYRPLFSRDGRWLAAITGIDATSGDYTIIRWDLDDLTRLPYVYRGHEGAIMDVAFNPDASLVATAGRDGAIRLWRADSPTAAPAILHQPGAQAEVRLWDASAADPAQASRLVGLRPADYRLLTTSADGRYVALTFESGTSDVLLWDLFRPLAPPLRLTHPGTVMAMKFGPGCNRPPSASTEPCHDWLAVGDWSGNLRLWDTRNLTVDSLAHVDLSHNTAVRDLAFSADGRLLVAGTGTPNSFDQYHVNIWPLDDLTAGANRLAPTTVLIGHTSIVRAVAISSSGRWVVSGAWQPDLTARLWDLATSTLEPATIFSFRDRPFAAAFSPNERWVAVGSWDATAQLVRLDNLSAPPVVLDQHRGRILSMAISPDSHWLATGGEDRRVILWDLTAPDPSVAFAVLRSPTGSGAGVQVAFSADSRWLSAFGVATFSSAAPSLVTADNNVHLYNLPVDELIDRVCLAAGRTATEEEWRRYVPDQPYSPVCPEQNENPLVTRLVAQSLRMDGNEQAATGDVAAAKALYAQAAMLDPSQDEAAAGTVEQRLALFVVERGMAAAGVGQIDLATQLLARAKALDPALVTDPEAEARRIAAERQQLAIANTVAEIRILAGQGAYGEAMQILAGLEQADPGLAITATLSAVQWNSLCWDGALAGQAQAVLPACDRAVSLAPADGGILDSRGLARALAGDGAGAIQDFELAVQWAEETGYDAAFIASRTAWIAALRAGENPFDATTLAQLR